jgi:hypothetical protein
VRVAAHAAVHEQIGDALEIALRNALGVRVHQPFDGCYVGVG